MDIMEETLLRISDPREETYGKWLSLEEIAEIIAPSMKELELVYSWLEAYEITGAGTRTTRDWVVVETTVNKVEQLLKCDIVYYQQRFSDQLIMRAIGDYHIPDDVAEVVDFVAGLHGFPYSSWKPSVYSGNERLGGNTPTTVNNLYNIAAPTGPCNCNSSQAVVEFSGANYSPSDLQLFFQDYATQLESQTQENIYGTNNPNGFISVEANLDVQYIMAIGGFIPTDDYVEPPNPSILDSFLDYTWVVGNQTNPPLVHSISWGDYGGSYNNNTVQRINNEFMIMGARGITVSLASGDNGVGCGDHCQAQEFDFPSSPYITMVGSSALTTAGIERAATFSSGGFSRDYYQPSYQKSAVEGYLNSGVKLPSTSYDAKGRAYPDVSALGTSLEVIVRGRPEPVDGTSCSAPIFGGVISLLNAQRAMAGKGPLGFINPWVYQNPSMFNDVTSGSNDYKCCEGFSATTGWDPITGMGTPNYPAMLQSAMALP
jgi:tripeptidyl-peptidase-1